MACKDEGGGGGGRGMRKSLQPPLDVVDHKCSIWAENFHPEHVKSSVETSFKVHDVGLLHWDGVQFHDLGALCDAYWKRRP